MSIEANKEIIRRLTDAFNDRNMTVIDELVDIDYIDHGPFHKQQAGREGMKQAHQYFYEGFPDVHETIEDIFAEEDKVVVRWICKGTHLGNFVSVPIPPTGKSAAVQGIDIFRIQNGKVTECWHIVDALSLLFQLEVMQPLVS